MKVVEIPVHESREENLSNRFYPTQQTNSKMGWWKADPIPPPPTTTSTPSPPSPSAQPPHPLPSSSSAADACPVDAQTRAIWLEQAAAQQKKSREAAAATAQQQTPLPPSHPKLPPHPSNIASPQECSSDRISQSVTSSEPAVSNTRHSLSHEREISSIPRALAASPPSSPAIPANAETETGASASGHWIYPSETQFFNAVLRKKTSSATPNELAATMPSVIPIHNAVNERAWALIKSWEGQSSAPCGGPKLRSFKGLGAGALSPRARMKSFAGYTAPFDRHDWVVERCGGETVEYIIDFYQGKASDAVGGQAPPSQQLNFYLDVRPKLNSVEGCKMRFERFVGWR